MQLTGGVGGPDHCGQGCKIDAAVQIAGRVVQVGAVTG